MTTKHNSKTYHTRAEVNILACQRILSQTMDYSLSQRSLKTSLVKMVSDIAR